MPYEKVLIAIKVVISVLVGAQKATGFGGKSALVASALVILGWFSYAPLVEKVDEVLSITEKAMNKPFSEGVTSELSEAIPEQKGD